MKIGAYELADNKTHVMGILNVTPDSFSDGGRFVTMDKVIEHANLMMQEGAAIIDVGGESTRPRYTMISADEKYQELFLQLKRLNQDLISLYQLTHIKALLRKRQYVQVPIWLMTYGGLCMIRRWQDS